VCGGRTELVRILNIEPLQAESALSLVHERENLQAHINPTTSPPETFNVPDANVIIRSSDLVDFRIHKSVLALASPFLGDLPSLPRTSDSESVDGLPVVELPEDSELLNSLVSLLYPVCPVIPNSYEKVLYLLAACQKYEMVSVLSSIRAKVKCGEFPEPRGVEAFTAYAIAASEGLVPEMESAARQTLDHPMTFKALGKRLRLFEGWALRDLASFRRRCRDRLIACLDPPGPSSIWISCPEAASRASLEYRQNPVLPEWIIQLLSRNQNDLKLQSFTRSLDIQSKIRGEYFAALQSHGHCSSCSAVHMKNGLTFFAELENKLAQARNKVPHSLYF
jgi:hypothetical protein